MSGIHLEFPFFTNYVAEQVFRFGSKAAGDLHTASFAPRQCQRRRAAQVLDRELRQQLFKPLASLVAIDLGDVEDRRDVVLHREAAKDAGLLRQVADPHLRAPVHWQRGGVLPVDAHRPALR